MRNRTRNRKRKQKQTDEEDVTELDAIKGNISWLGEKI